MGGSGKLQVHANLVTILEGEPYFVFHPEERLSLDRFSLILMRKDPPVDLNYLYATQLLSLVSDRIWVINDPRALRDWNEKLAILRFPKWIPPTIVSCNKKEVDSFVDAQGGTALLKSLEGFAGKAVKQVHRSSANYMTMIDEMTFDGERPIMTQAFLLAVQTKGEKRIFMIDGKAWGAILKLPPEGGFITNPDLGGRLQETEITSREKRLCAEVGPFLKKNGIFFAGLDLIDERLTEINITSPGLVWEWSEIDNYRYEDDIVDVIEKRISK